MEEGNSELNVPYVSLQPEQDFNDVTIATDLSDEQSRLLKKLLEEYQDIFSDRPGNADFVDCQLTFTTQIPIYVRPYPVPFALHDLI